ncbi:MAG TPA: hypothetical protein DC017_18185 [Candidatus Wallbacteria bacterium]|nr:hypothetical protein [Candidatus Wallbacteria bacterium]
MTTNVIRRTFFSALLIFLSALAFLAAGSFFPGAFAQSDDDDDIDKLQQQALDNQNINEKVNKQLAEKGIKLDSPDAVSEAMKKLQGMTGADEESATSGVYWFFMIFISIVGMGFFSAGKRNEDAYLMASGAIMMVYPYCVSGTFWLVSIGILLTVLPFVMRFYSTSGK